MNSVSFEPGVQDFIYIIKRYLQAFTKVIHRLMIMRATVVSRLKLWATSFSNYKYVGAYGFISASAMFVLVLTLPEEGASSASKV